MHVAVVSADVPVTGAVDRRRRVDRRTWAGIARDGIQRRVEEVKPAGLSAYAEKTALATPVRRIGDAAADLLAVQECRPVRPEPVKRDRPSAERDRQAGGQGRAFNRDARGVRPRERPGSHELKAFV